MLHIPRQIPLRCWKMRYLDSEVSQRRAEKHLAPVRKLLRQILPPAFHGYRQQFGLEGIHVHDTVALMSVLHPELFETTEMAGDVETSGEFTNGMTVFDRRRVPVWRHNIDVVTDMQTDAVVDAIIRDIHHAAEKAG